MYSFGVCLWECLTAQVPYHGMTAVAVVNRVGMGGSRLEFPDLSPPGGVSIGTNSTSNVVNGTVARSSDVTGGDHARVCSMLREVFTQCTSNDPSLRPTFVKLIRTFEGIMRIVRTLPPSRQAEGKAEV